MRGRRKQQWAAVLLMMTIQPECLVINGSAICQAVAEERVVIRVMSAEESVAQKVGGESEKKGTKREDKAEMESGKEPKGSR